MTSVIEIRKRSFERLPRPRFVHSHLREMMFAEHPSPAGPAQTEDDNTERPAAPASPSNSWSSAETAPAPTQELAGADEPPAPARPKRCKISREQLDVLVKSFEEEPLPNFEQRQAMAKHLGMTPLSVQIWFQNRRQRLKPTPKPAPEALTQPSASHQHHAQHYGMPGLAAAAGLFGAGYGSPAQLPMHPPTGMQSFMPCDVMEPFAATKALLGAGYQPQTSMLNHIGMRSYQHAGGSEVLPPQQAAIPDVMQTPSTQAACAAAADAYAMSAAAAHAQAACYSGAPPHAPAAPAPAPDAQAAAPAADGLLLLLACGGGALAPVPERSAIASA